MYFSFYDESFFTCSDFLLRNKVEKILFIPYASTKPGSYDEYTEKVAKPLNEWGFEVNSIHKYDDPVSAVKKAQSIFIGNCFSCLI